MVKTMSDLKVKPITGCFLYTKLDGYTEKMSNAILKAERIDRNSEIFSEDVALELKRSKAPSYTMKILTSKNTHLIWPTDPLPRGIRVFAAKDIKRDKNICVFIDCNGVITKRDNGRYKVKTDLLAANLISAKNNMVYYKAPDMLIKKGSDLVLMAKCFGKLFAHLIDYIGNISVIPEQKDKCRYLAAKYFLSTVAGLDNEDKINSIAAKAAELTDSQERIFGLATSSVNVSSLPAFIDDLKNVFKLDKLSLTLVIEKWMYTYGTSTVLALEFLPSFLTMITDAYCGVYLNMQKTIEKVLGKDLVEMGKNNIYEK
jgi:hypothetical protein